jgi:biopolymer transport protein ExbD
VNFRGRLRPDEPEINLIPMIDLLLVILIFLAVSTTYARLTELQVALPAASQDAKPRGAAEVMVAVSRDGRYLVGSTPVVFTDVAALSRRLREAARSDSQATVVIQADAQARHQDVVNVLEAARLAGLGRVGFATMSPAGDAR